MLDTWKDDVVTDVKVVPSDSECSNLGIEWKDMYAYHFGGFDSGCDCRDISYYASRRYRVSMGLGIGSCSYNETRAYCNRVDTNMEPKEFT